MRLAVNSTQKNLIGSQIRELRTARRLSIEKGQRLVTDIELKILCTFFQVDPNTLLGFRS